ncbi:uncharacterized protein [Garra rufa]|uniref:uncharacterized protein n=1 Tax=Garra rufa TaxID=137080 RepID=UPI003CCE8853
MLLFFVFHVFINGVFGESVSVMEGDSVSLHTGLTEIQKDDVLQWRFGTQGTLIAQVNQAANKSITYDDVLDGRFGRRMKLDNQTGGLTIRNIRTEHSGFYEYTSSKHTLNKIFNISVVPVDEVKSVLVLVGDSVTLHTDLAEIQNDDEIQWRFEHQSSPLAEINRKARKISTYDATDGRFRDKLQLDYLTGSLTIRNIETNHSGLYEVDISSSSSKHTIHKTFNVTVSGEMKSETVKEGESVTLQTGFTEIQVYDFITWIFGNTVIAEIHKAAQLFYIYDGDDERFKDRLRLDNQTGSLTITECKISNSGLYELKINSNRHTVQRFTVTVSASGVTSCVKAWIVTVLLVSGTAVAFMIHYDHKISKLKYAVNPLSVAEGVAVTLKADAELQTNDQVRWTFGDKKSPIAEIKGGAISTYDGPDGRFRDRLMLDKTTGSLTITNTRTTDAGSYKLEFIHKRKKTSKWFLVTVFESVSVMEGETVTLNTNTELQAEDEILWMFGDKDAEIANTKGGTRITNTANGPDGKFRNRLKLDHLTGTLFIINTRTEDTGEYKLKITRSGNVSLKLFRVTVFDQYRSIPEKRHLLQSVHSINE